MLRCRVVGQQHPATGTEPATVPDDPFPCPFLTVSEPMGRFYCGDGRCEISDGRLLLVGSANQTVSIYDVATRTRLGDPIDTGRPIVSGNAGPVLRPDGNAVVVNGRDGLAIWNLEPDRLADAACSLTGRNLTRAEWDTYLGDLGPYRATCPGA